METSTDSTPGWLQPLHFPAARTTFSTLPQHQRHKTSDNSPRSADHRTRARSISTRASNAGSAAGSSAVGTLDSIDPVDGSAPESPPAQIPAFASSPASQVFLGAATHAVVNVKRYTVSGPCATGCITTWPDGAPITITVTSNDLVIYVYGQTRTESIGRITLQQTDGKSESNLISLVIGPDGSATVGSTLAGVGSLRRTSS